LIIKHQNHLSKCVMVHFSYNLPFLVIDANTTKASKYMKCQMKECNLFARMHEHRHNVCGTKLKLIW
jgi:hypothetical protein